MISITRTFVRRIATALAATALGAGLGLVAPATAGAAPSVAVSCQSSGLMHFSPGVQLFPLRQHITYDGQAGQCNDNSGLGIRTASLSESFQGVVLSCEGGGFGTGSGSGTIDWTSADGFVRHSTVELRFDHNIGPLVSISGSVISGPFTGHTFSSTFTTNLFGGAGKCTIGAPFGGVTEADFDGQFTIN